MTHRELAKQWFSGLTEEEQIELIKKYHIGAVGLDDITPYQIELIYSRENEECDYEHDHMSINDTFPDTTYIQDYTP